MKHMASGAIACLGVLVLAGCYSDPSAGINNGVYNTLQATPSSLVLRVGDSTQVIARLVDNANSGAITSYTVGSVGAGILVHYQANYRPIFNAALDTLVPTTDKDAQQYYVVGAAVGIYTFTLTPTSVNTGATATVTVTVTPLNLGAALNKTTANPGDTVTATAPTGTLFSQTSAITFATGSVAIVSRSADSTQFKFVVSGGVTGPATITKVGNIASPTIAPVTLVTTSSLTTPAQVGPTLSVTTAAAGASVVLTAAPNGFFSTTSTVTFTTGSISTPVRSADSTTLTFLVGPGITGPAVVTNMGLKSGPTLPLITETSTNSLTTTALTSAPVTIANSTPALGTTTTIQLGGGLRFLGTSHVFVGGAEAGIQSVSADSSTATVSLMTGSTGTVTFTNIALSFLTSVPLALPSSGSMTVGSVYSGPTDANANVAANATTVTLNKSQSMMINDGGLDNVSCPAYLVTAFGASTCRFYKITLVAGTMSARIKWNASATSDMAVVLVNSANTACVSVLADDQGQVSGSIGDHATQPVNCGESANVSLTAGTYLLIALEFDYGTVVVPSWYQVLISQP